MNVTAISEIVPLESIFKTDNGTELEKNQTQSFADTLKSAIDGVKQMENESKQASYDLALGKTDDLESVMIQSAKASTAIEVTTQIVTRAVNAYKEITQMQL